MSSVDQDKNLAFEFIKIARRNPDLLAITSIDLAINYEQLAQSTVKFAENMQRLGIGQSSTVVVDTTDILVTIASLAATALVGAKWIAFKNYKALSHHITPTHWLRSKESSETSFTLIDAQWRADPIDIEDLDITQFPGYAAPSDAWLIANTSGTTGTPKLVELSQEMLFERSKAAGLDFIERKTVMCCLFSCIALPSITRSFAALLNGATIVEIANANLWRNVGVNLVIGSPTQAISLLDDVDIDPKVECIHIVGSKTSDKLAKRLLEKFDEVWDVYASSETNRSYVNRKLIGEDGNIQTRGEALDSVVEIVNENGVAISELNVLGDIRIKNNYLAKSYVNNADATKKSFRNGWFYPGDIGVWAEHKELQIMGRANDVINLGGVKLNTAEIDTTLQSCDVVADAMCFKNPNAGEIAEMFAFIVFENADEEASGFEKLRAYCADKLDFVKTPSKLISINAVPRAHDGGAKRWQCAEIYKQHVEQS